MVHRQSGENDSELDRVEVKGSRITFQGKPAIIAAEITKDGQTLTLRDASGMPVWRGWRKEVSLGNKSWEARV